MAFTDNDSKSGLGALTFIICSVQVDRFRSLRKDGEEAGMF
jgi:hypothetical protein